MHELSQPDHALADRVLNDVSYEQRLVGYRRRSRWGQLRTHMYNFREVALLFNDRHPMIALGQLEQWLRTAIGDEELADKVVAIAAASTSEKDRLLQIRKLLDQRLEQCREIVT